MTSKLRFAPLTLCWLVLVSLTLVASADSTGIDDHMKTGKADLKSAGQIVFGPDNTLFIADSLGTAVFAVDVADSGEFKAPTERRWAISDIDEKVAALLGTTAHDISINDLAVHPETKNMYLSVTRGQGDNAKPALVKATFAGEVSEVALDNVRFSKAMISNAPAADAKDRRGRNLRTSTITDLAFAGGQVWVAGLSNEEFASNLRRIPFPFTGEMEASSIEIYHGAHGKFETHAPIRTMMPFEIKGKTHVLAAYTCTPLVTFPIDDLKDGAHVKGKTVAELGFGNAPLDMVKVEQDGETYIFVVNSSRAGMKIRAVDIGATAAITKEVEGITEGVPYEDLPLGGVLRMAHVADGLSVVLRRDVTSGSLQIRSMNLAWYL